MMANSQQVTVLYKLLILSKINSHQTLNTLSPFLFVSVWLFLCKYKPVKHEGLQIATSDMLWFPTSSNTLHCDQWLVNRWFVCITLGWFAYTLHRFTSFDIEKWSTGKDSLMAKSLGVSHTVLQTVQHVVHDVLLKLSFIMLFAYVLTAV